jgi:hypothetical protein
MSHLTKCSAVVQAVHWKDGKVEGNAVEETFVDKQSRATH